MPNLATQENNNLRIRIDPTKHGQHVFLGNASDSEVSTWMVQFVPDDPSFQGSLGPVGRVWGTAPNADFVGFVPIAYIRANIGGVAYPRDVVTGDLINTPFLIEVPADGMAVAFLVACTQGAGYLYSMPMLGPAA